ncbi:helix-turn-helix domain-containing protein [uncultured Fusobacterium sp.]|uniref:helix-turn-helix domain-containing protein n=1 Tax=uncultured Fusobacterium sp. TaxID=159267 RepID=UPI0025EC50CF|nr:helix-turn-helix domain-containing protein [uncultured Fusobacterium sp.]
MLEKYKELENYPDILTLKDVANYCGISKDSARKLCLTNQLKHIRIGRLYKITKENLVNFLENNQ